MKLQWKTVSILAVLCTLGCSCGDIIKTRNPTKRVNTPEPEQKSSSLYGVCTNFHGAWTVDCAEPIDGVPAAFQLLQQACDFFVVHPHNISFYAKELTWSDARDAVTLNREQDKLVLEKRDGVRQGTWTRGEQSCTMLWSPNP
ncbi:hypothetical protein [Oligoflexus tunisiensis]|uniref:hypothetical protein n=1 Tax=Oligoflexus tunisiensis TaxID=708132 RepID=UPI00114CED1C|nr:hypothetical protein [Oligoflexus tunisiensis]